jgi:hypothetical protein
LRSNEAPVGSTSGGQRVYDKKSLRVGTSIRAHAHLQGNWAVELTTSKGDGYYVETALDVESATGGQVFLWKAARGSLGPLWGDGRLSYSDHGFQDGRRTGSGSMYSRGVQKG